MGRARTWTDEQFIRAVNNNYSIASVLREIGLKVTGANYSQVKRSVKRLNLSMAHFMGQGYLKGKTNNWTKKKPLSKILVKDSEYVSINNLKKRLLKEGVVENKCYKCGQLPEWKGEKLVMVLDHINGENTDHRIENLRLLCPNCNSQTKTFAGRNRKINRIPKVIKLCKDCGIELSNKRKSKRCLSCSVKKRKFCIDCGKLISQNATRCKSCSSVEKNKKLRKVARPQKKQLLQEINNLGYAGTGRKYGVSDNAIRKWLKK